MKRSTLLFSIFCGILSVPLFLLTCGPNHEISGDFKNEMSILNEHFKNSGFVEDRKVLKLDLEKKISTWSQTVDVMKIYGLYDWRISDNIIMNIEKTKALVFTCFIKKTGHGKVDMIAGEKVDEDWIFYKRGMPSFNYEYDSELRKGVPLEENEILRLSVINLINDGLISNGKISQDYINIKWFRENRIETHQKFLNNQY